MECTILVGNDDQAKSRAARELLAPYPADTVEHLDVSRDGVGSFHHDVAILPMFGRRVYLVDGAEAISKTELGALARSADQSDAVVVARASRLTPSQRAVWSGLGEVRVLDLPKGGGVARALQAEASQRGIRLTTEARGVLAGVPFEQARVALDLLGSAGVDRPTAEQVAQVAGDAAPEAAPWVVTDAFDRRDLVGLANASERANPVVAVSFLTTHLARIGLVLEAGAHTPAEVQELCRLPQRFQAERVLTASKTATLPQVTAAIDLLATLSLSVRRSGGRDAFLAGVVELGQLFT